MVSLGAMGIDNAAELALQSFAVQHRLEELEEVADTEFPRSRPAVDYVLRLLLAQPRVPDEIELDRHELALALPGYEAIRAGRRLDEDVLVHHALRRVPPLPGNERKRAEGVVPWMDPEVFDPQLTASKDEFWREGFDRGVRHRVAGTTWKMKRGNRRPKPKALPSPLPTPSACEKGAKLLPRSPTYSKTGNSS